MKAIKSLGKKSPLSLYKFSYFIYFCPKYSILFYQSTDFYHKNDKYKENTHKFQMIFLSLFSTSILTNNIWRHLLLNGKSRLLKSCENPQNVSEGGVLCIREVGWGWLGSTIFILSISREMRTLVPLYPHLCILGSMENKSNVHVAKIRSSNIFSDAVLI